MLFSIEVKNRGHYLKNREDAFRHGRHIKAAALCHTNFFIS